MPGPQPADPFLLSSPDLCCSSVKVHGNPCGLLKPRFDVEPPGGLAGFQGALGGLSTWARGSLILCDGAGCSKDENSLNVLRGGFGPEWWAIPVQGMLWSS